MPAPTRQRLRLAAGSELSFLTAGDSANPAVLLIHGFPSSARTFREVIPTLAEVAHVIAPDLPGYGESDVLAEPSFPAMGEAVAELLTRLGIGPRYVYLHDYGAPVGFQIAMQAPELVLGLIIQNANAHRTGFDESWKATEAFWADPSPENEKAATGHLSHDGTRTQYVGNVPAEIAVRIRPEIWEEDWRVMQLPGRMETQRALLKDYGNYAARFGAIGDYLRQWRPPALLLWGRHDPFFALREVLSWLEDLPRMEAHLLDAGHFLLETHADVAGRLMREFVERSGRRGRWGTRPAQ